MDDPAHTARSSVVGSGYAAGGQEPGVHPLPEPDVGGAPETDGGVPDSEPDRLPRSEQFLVELELELVAEEPDVELVPELSGVVDVSAPPASTLRRRICMVVGPFCVFGAPAQCEPVRKTLRSGSECRRRATWTGATSHATN